MTIPGNRPGRWPAHGTPSEGRGPERNKIALSLSGGGITGALYEA